MLNTLKKFSVTVAATTLIAIAVVPAAFAQEPQFQAAHTFTDVNDRYEESVSFFYEAEIIKGKSPSLFGIYENLTRGDAAVILANTLGLDTENAPDAGFKDLNDRYKGAVNALAELGIVSGYSPDKFEPYKPLSRGAMAKLLVLTFDLQDYAEETPFTDASGVFEPYIEALYGSEITSGKTATTYGTYQEIVRGDFANLLYKTLLFDPFAPESVEMVDSNSLSVSFVNAIPEEFTAEETAEIITPFVELSNGEFLELTPSNGVLSSDRKMLTFDHGDLTGKSGTMYIYDFVLPFSY
ncbi:S-layer homology domain-containing protein [Niallia oryzisoli]|uniref:S-layer homology domain-containing protein n=1 Tax=Niallia oryzisoli TaxID=1737571 RepID=A0ABZ2CEG4_9BACI